MEPEQQQRYFELKKQLTNLNYTANFGIDAMDIVQQLFSDLVSTTESYTQLQEREYNLSQDLSLAQAQLFPLRKENARLTRENQQLHLETIKLREELGDYKDGLNIQVKGLEDELQQYHYLVLSKDEDLQRAEKERLRLREAYEALASSSLLSGGVKVKRSIKMSGIVSDGTVESKSPDSTSGPSSPSRMRAKNMRATDGDGDKTSTLRSETEQARLITTLQEQVESSQQAVKASTAEVRRLNDALARREEELLKYARKSGVLDATVGSDEGRIQSLLAADTSNQRIIEQLNGQVDFLNEHLALRERQLAESSREIAGIRELRAECDYRGVLLEREKGNNRELVAQLIEMESRISDLQRLTDPNTPVSSRGGSLRGGPQTPPSTSSAKSIVSGTTSNSVSPGLVERLSTEKNELTAEIARLSSTLTSMEEGDSVLRGRLARTEEARLQLKEELDRAKEESSRTAFSLHQNRAALDEAVSENEELKEKVQELQVKLESEAERSDDHRARALHLDSQVKILEASKVRLEGAIREMKSESSELRRNQSEKSFEAEMNGQQSRRWEKELQNLQVLLESTQNELADNQDEMINIKKEKDAVSNAYQSERDKLVRVQARLEEASDDLEVRTTELQRLVEANRRLQLQMGEAQHHARAETDRSVGQSALQQQHAAMEQQFMQLQEDYKHLAQSSSALETQYQSSSIQVEALLAERDSLLRKVSEREEATEAAQKKQQELQLENVRLQNQISTSTNSIESVESQRTHHVQKIYEQQQSITELQSELRLAQRRLDSFAEANQEAQDSVVRAEANLQRANDRAKGLEKDVLALKQEVGTARSEKRVLEEDGMVLKSRLDEALRSVSHLKDDLREAFRERDALQKQMDELKTVLNTMSGSEKDAAARVKRSEREVLLVREQLDDMEEEMTALKKELSDRNSKLRDLHDSLEALDQERDALQLQLDNELESEEERRSVLQQHKQKADELSALLGQRDKQLAAIRKDSESEHRRAENGVERVRALVDENAELRRRLGMKQNEVGAASEDLLLMTKENQSLTSELAITSADRSKYQKAVMELNEDVAALQQTVRALEIERGDLLQTYRTCLQEKRKCEVDLNAMSEMKLKLAHTINDLRGTVTDLNGELASRKSAETRTLSDRSALLLQLETLNDQLVRSSKQTEDWENDANRLAQENHGLKQTILTLQQRSVTLVNRAASAADANKILQARVTAIERERDALRAIVDSERRRSSDMAQLVAMSRTREARVADRLTVSGLEEDEDSHDKTDRLMKSVLSSSMASAAEQKGNGGPTGDSSPSSKAAEESRNSTMSSITATHASTVRHQQTTTATTTSKTVIASRREQTHAETRGKSNAEELLGISSEDDSSSDDVHERDE